MTMTQEESPRSLTFAHFLRSLAFAPATLAVSEPVEEPEPSLLGVC